MRFSILHISDLHRDLQDEINNTWLIDSLARDFERFVEQDPSIMKPSLCILSGDLVYGVKPNAGDATTELTRQYTQAEQFLIGLADRFFEGSRSRIILLPGNHDVNFDDVMKSVQRIDIPTDPINRATLVAELLLPNSRLRWSWRELCFYKITDETRYKNRVLHFATMYESFYQNRRKYPLESERQYDLFDFPDLGFSVVALNSCYNNDPLHPAGAIHPAALTHACRDIGHADRIGWLTAATWHHNLNGGPTKDNYLEAEFLQLLIDAGVSLGFHGHQHLPDCFDERYRLGPSPRKMTIISASTLCADQQNLRPGVPRSYNIIEVDTVSWTGRLHQRHMVNELYSMPVWGPGHFNITNLSYVDFELCKPLSTRPAQLDVQIVLDKAEKLLGHHKWNEAADVLESVKDTPLARPLLVKVLGELGDAHRTTTVLWPPLTIAEVVTVGGAILENGMREDAERFVRLDIVALSEDASVHEITRRVRERWIK